MNQVTAPKKGAVEPAAGDKPDLEKGQAIERPVEGQKQAFDVEHGGDKRRVMAVDELEARALYNDARKTWPPAKTVTVTKAS